MPYEKNAQLFINKEISLYKLKKLFNEALECFNEAIKINPLNYRVWFNKGATLGKLWQYNEAVDCFDKTLKINKKLK